MPVKRFRTRPVEIDAMRFTGGNYRELLEWTGGSFLEMTKRDRNLLDMSDEFTGQVYDKLHQSWIGVIPGQWIVRGAKGEFYPCDDETFHWKYEEVEKPLSVRTPEYDDNKCKYAGRHQGNVCFSDGDMCKECGWVL